MATLNQCSFIGRLGKDPELQVTSEGKSVTRFKLAVDQGKDQPMWLYITTWDKLAETVEMYAHKGTQVYVQGRLQLRDYTDQQGIKRQAVGITATMVQLLDKIQRSDDTTPSATRTEREPFLPDFPNEQEARLPT